MPRLTFIMSFINDINLAKKEVRMYSFRCSFHKFVEWEGPGRTASGGHSKLCKLFHNKCDSPSSLVREIFAQEVHLRHRRHMDLDFLVSPLLHEIFYRPLLHAWPQPHTSHNRRSSLESQGNRYRSFQNLRIFNVPLFSP